MDELEEAGTLAAEAEKKILLNNEIAKLNSHAMINLALTFVAVGVLAPVLQWWGTFQTSTASVELWIGVAVCIIMAKGLHSASVHILERDYTP